MTVTVKELMTQVDAERVVDAFLLLDYNFSAENFENSFIEQYKAVPILRTAIEKNIELFAECECTPNDGAELYTIFIIYADNDDYYTNQNQKKKLYCFATCDEEVLPVVDKNFRVFDSKCNCDVKINHYSFDDVTMQEMANYTIAQSSIDELGEEICAAKILSELFFWGWLPEQREKAVNDLYARLGKTMDEKKAMDSITSITFEEVIRKHEEFLADMSEDEKAYYLAKKRFEEETEYIKKRYSINVGNKIHQLYIDAIKTEYKNR